MSRHAASPSLSRIGEPPPACGGHQRRPESTLVEALGPGLLSLSETTESLLLTELRQLRSDVNSLLERTPDTRLIWLEPADFAALVGKSTRTLLTWRDQGKFRDCSIRRKGNRFEYHRVHAMADVERGQA